MSPFRRILIAGNWKMNAGGVDGCRLAEAVAGELSALEDVEVVVAPPFTALAAVAQELSESNSPIHVSAQNMAAETAGAYTGEVSAAMLLECGAKWVILGHSERRGLFGESDELVVRKVRAAVKARLKPIVCVGETLAEREAGQTLEVVRRQLLGVLPILAEEPGYGVIAYEPVWAIGTGRTATAEQAQEVHAAIRETLLGLSEELSEGTRLLYGGSVKPENAESLLSRDDVDGLLVGGASLDAGDFAKIVLAGEALAKSRQEA